MRIETHHNGHVTPLQSLNIKASKSIYCRYATSTCPPTMPLHPQADVLPPLPPPPPNPRARSPRRPRAHRALRKHGTHFFAPYMLKSRLTFTPTSTASAGRRSATSSRSTCATCPTTTERERTPAAAPLDAAALRPASPNTRALGDRPRPARCAGPRTLRSTCPSCRFLSFASLSLAPSPRPIHPMLACRYSCTVHILLDSSQRARPPWGRRVPGTRRGRDMCAASPLYN